MSKRCIETIRSESGAFRARVIRDSEWCEYVVRFYTDGVYDGTEADYHTDDKRDALATACAEMTRRENRAE